MSDVSEFWPILPAGGAINAADWVLDVWTFDPRSWVALPGNKIGVKAVRGDQMLSYHFTVDTGQARLLAERLLKLSDELDGDGDAE
jgi:hypothetical protein